MARKKLREARAKKLLAEWLSKLAGIQLPFSVAQISAAHTLEDAAAAPEGAWLKTSRLVVKPDMLFGKRGKNNLVGLDLDFAGAAAFIAERMGTSITVGTTTGKLTHFIVEPFIPHTDEFYLSLASSRAGNTIGFSPTGGMDIEDHWDSVVYTPVLPVTTAAPDLPLGPLLAAAPEASRPALAAFITGVYRVFLDLDFTLIEFNPFILDPASGAPFPLDMRAEVDDYAAFKNMRKWGSLEFPPAFGFDASPAEDFIAGLDDKSGASLKLTVLNPKGRIWCMVAGGGASVIYADTVSDLGWGPEMGNYGEYSGNPTETETYHYARTVLGLATAAPDGRPRVLLVGGGVANFTDVAKTFKGIIAAIREAAADIKAAQLRIYVRRGGPNYRAGLKAMRELGAELGLTIEVYGPESNLTAIVPMAIEYLKSNGATGTSYSLEHPAGTA